MVTALARQLSRLESFVFGNDGIYERSQQPISQSPNHCEIVAASSEAILMMDCVLMNEYVHKVTGSNILQISIDQGFLILPQRLNYSKQFRWS